MTGARRIPPVHSPIHFAGGLRSILSRGLDSSPARLEEILADRYHADHVILCGSGTQALQLALAFARRSTGRDEAALPGYTCYDVVSAAIGAGARAIFYDIDPDLLLPEQDSLDEALGSRPAAVVVVHQFGIPTPLGPVLDAAPTGTWVIEDAAQAHGGSLEGRPLGSLAPLSVLSFGRGKGWTGGGGGALLLRGEAAEEASALRRELDSPAGGAAAAAKLGAQWLLGRPSLYALPAALPWLGLGETRYVPPVAPAAMAPAVARLVLANSAAAEAEVARRRGNALRLRQQLAGIPDIHVPPERSEPGYLRLPLRAPGRSAESVLGGDARRLGILSGYPRALPSLEVVGNHRGDSSPTPGSETLARELFTAPTHSLLRARDVDRIAAVLERAL